MTELPERIRASDDCGDQDWTTMDWAPHMGPWTEYIRADLFTDAARDVLAERARQISAEGWTPEHDDRHDEGELARAAGSYALGVKELYRNVWSGLTQHWQYKPIWPWDEEWWKPTDRRRDLVKAAALIIAEIERLDRAAAGAAATLTPPQQGSGR